MTVVIEQNFPGFAPFADKGVVGNSIKPSRKLSVETELPDIAIGENKSFLREIVGQREVRPGKLAKETSHTRLMTTNQLAKSVLVVINKNSSDKVRIS